MLSECSPTIGQAARQPSPYQPFWRPATRSDRALGLNETSSRIQVSRYWTAVTEIEAERREVHRRLAVSREASLLAETLDFGEDAAAVWAERPVHWKRAILKLVTERIEIQRGQQIHRVGLYGTEFDRERVKVKFAA
jgi:hypothetical protein